MKAGFLKTLLFLAVVVLSLVFPPRGFATVDWIVLDRLATGRNLSSTIRGDSLVLGGVSETREYFQYRRSLGVETLPKSVSGVLRAVGEGKAQVTWHDGEAETTVILSENDIPVPFRIRPAAENSVVFFGWLDPRTRLVISIEGEEGNLRRVTGAGSVNPVRSELLRRPSRHHQEISLVYRAIEDEVRDGLRRYDPRLIEFEVQDLGPREYYSRLALNLAIKSWLAGSPVFADKARKILELMENFEPGSDRERVYRVLGHYLLDVQLPVALSDRGNLLHILVNAMLRNREVSIELEPYLETVKQDFFTQNSRVNEILFALALIKDPLVSESLNDLARDVIEYLQAYKGRVVIYDLRGDYGTRNEFGLYLLYQLTGAAELKQYFSIAKLQAEAPLLLMTWARDTETITPRAESIPSSAARYIFGRRGILARSGGGDFSLLLTPSGIFDIASRPFRFLTFENRSDTGVFLHNTDKTATVVSASAYKTVIFHRAGVMSLYLPDTVTVNPGGAGVVELERITPYAVPATLKITGETVLPGEGLYLWRYKATPVERESRGGLSMVDGGDWQIFFNSQGNLVGPALSTDAQAVYLDKRGNFFLYGGSVLKAGDTEIFHCQIPARYVSFSSESGLRLDSDTSPGTVRVYYPASRPPDALVNDSRWILSRGRGYYWQSDH